MPVAPADLRRQLLAGAPVVSGWCMLPSAAAAELLAARPFDVLTVDMQHGLVGYTDALVMLQAVGRFGMATLCRVPWNEPGVIGRMLDAGYDGVICPMVDTQADAERLVRACRYPPLGSRSYGPTRARRLHGDGYGASANRHVAVLAMIETAAGLANLDAILGVDGIDGVYIGPADLALSLGHAPTLNSSVPEVVNAILHIGRRARACGKVAGIHCGDGAATRAKLDEGFNFVALGTDISLLENAVGAQLILVRGTGLAQAVGQY